MTATDPFLLIRATSRALLLASGLQDAPVGIWGTCFVADYKRNGERWLFVITASHLTGKNHSSDLLVLPSEHSHAKLRLSNGIGIWPPDEEPDHVDVIVYPASLADLDAMAVRKGRVLLLGGEVMKWEPRARVAQFYVIGFPRELSEVDFSTGTVHTTQTVLVGRYRGVARPDGHVHALDIHDGPLLDEYAGFSGSPVFCVYPQLGDEPQVRFAGIAISGTAASRTVHFIDAISVETVLRTALDYRAGRLRGEPRTDELG